jgi:IS605 OrfB family transposase
MFKAFRYRIKDSNESLRERFKEMGYAVNRIWNNANQTQIEALHTEGISWPSHFDLNKATTGWGGYLKLHSTTVQSVNSEYCIRRKQFKKAALNWRSNSKSLTWIPFKSSALRIDRETGKTKFNKLEFNLWYSRPWEGEIKTGSINADSKGRFYLNLICKLPDFPGIRPINMVGIDLGLKSVATLSDGTSYEAPRIFRKSQEELAKAQRKGKKKLVQGKIHLIKNKHQKRVVRNIHAKIANRRKDFNHKLSNEITNKYSHIFVGNVKSSDIIKTQAKGMAKSVYDVSWFQLKSFLVYKALAKGGVCQEVSEKYSTQTCSSCGCISAASPKGKAGLNIREWICSDCGTHHDRDTNAARNILQSGTRLLQAGSLDTN